MQYSYWKDNLLIYIINMIFSFLKYYNLNVSVAAEKDGKIIRKRHVFLEPEAVPR
jgi:hypothetical protein